MIILVTILVINIYFFDLSSNFRVSQIKKYFLYSKETMLFHCHHPKFEYFMCKNVLKIRLIFKNLKQKGSFKTSYLKSKKKYFVIN